MNSLYKLFYEELVLSSFLHLDGTAIQIDFATPNKRLNVMNIVSVLECTSKSNQAWSIANSKCLLLIEA